MIVDDRTNYVSAYGIVRTPPVRYAEESGPLCALIASICALFFTKESVKRNTIADDGFTNGEVLAFGGVRYVQHSCAGAMRSRSI